MASLEQVCAQSRRIQVEHRGSLRGRVALQVDEIDNSALTFRQLPPEFSDERAKSLAIYTPARIRLIHESVRCCFGTSRESRTVPRLFSHPRCRSACNAVKPNMKRTATLILIEPSEGEHEGFLHDIVGLIGVRGVRENPAVHAGLHAADKKCERPLVSGSRLFDERIDGEGF